MSTTVEIISVRDQGIGDVIVAACVVAGIRRSRPSSQVVFQVPQQYLQWAVLFGDASMTCGSADAPPSGHVWTPYVKYAPRERADLGAQTRHVYYAEECKAAPVLPKITLAEEDVEWADQVRGSSKMLVVMAPYANAWMRSWPPEHYGSLIDGLRSRGATIVLLDQAGAEARLQRFDARLCWGQSPGRVAALIRSADLFVGNDSGTTHLAGVLQVRAIALCGTTRGESVFGFYRTVTTVQATHHCTMCYWRDDRGFTQACVPDCVALRGIAPSTVERAALEILATTATRGVDHRETTISPGHEPAHRTL